MDDKEKMRAILVNVFAAISLHGQKVCPTTADRNSETLAVRAFEDAEKMYEQAEKRGLLPEDL